MWSSALVMVIWLHEDNSNITLRNISAYNVELGSGVYASLFYIQTFGQLNIYNTHFENTSTEL
jgi:hypothetical protein